MPRARHASAGWLAERRARERAHFERRYAGDETLSPVVVAEVLLRELRPCFETGGYKYSDNKQAFYELIERHGGWAGREHVLDYGCGVAGWSLYYALTGARRISGFDISQNAIRRGRERVRRQGYADRITLQVMDAADLGYASNTFDLVIGRAVLHHVIKYPRVFAEIHRVLRPGGSAWFMEGLADFPLWRLWWAWKGDVDSGDVPIHAAEVRRRARSFSRVDIHGDTFVFSLKTLLWSWPLSPRRRRLLAACKRADERLFRCWPAARRWGSFSYIHLVK